MTNKHDLKKEIKKQNKKSELLAFVNDTIVSKAFNNLQSNSMKKIKKWNNLSNAVTINAYD